MLMDGDQIRLAAGSNPERIEPSLDDLFSLVLLFPVDVRSVDQLWEIGQSMFVGERTMHAILTSEPWSRRRQMRTCVGLWDSTPRR